MPHPNAAWPTEAGTPVGSAALAAYGLLGLPLAMAALPVYVQAPTHYSGTLGLPLALTGTALFAARLIDTAQEPFIGQGLDRLAQRQWLRPVLWLAALVLGLAFAGIWLPPAGLGHAGLSLWLGAMLVMAYTAHSVLQIAYLGWGARLGEPALLQRAAAWREGMGLIGIVLASTLGVCLVQAQQAAWALPLYSLLFAALLGASLWLLLHAAPPWRDQRNARASGWRAAWRTPAFRRVLWPYFLNALSVALPATLVLFFVADRLAAARWAGLFLAMYFLAGAASLGWWNRQARRHGLVRAWQLGMVMAVAGFAITPWLGPQSAWLFALVCLLTGWSVGADLVLPPVLLASRIPLDAQPTGYYGVSSLLGKLALASSALALPLLAHLGYQPSTPAAPTVALTWLYAGLPCLFKLLAFFTLRRAETSKESP